MILLFISLSLFAGFIVGVRVGLARRRAPTTTMADVEATAIAASLGAAQRQAPVIAKMAWQHAAVIAKKDRRALAGAVPWAEMLPDQRELVFRIASAAIEVVAEDAKERLKVAMASAKLEEISK